MNFQQLRFVREAVRQNMNLTEVANVLYTSQSGVSKQIKDLEDELGVDIFIRRGKRLTGLTEPGKAVHQLIERMLLDAENLRRVVTLGGSVRVELESRTGGALEAELDRETWRALGLAVGEGVTAVPRGLRVFPAQ